MRILVVGGAGYIGSHAVRFFLNAGHQVAVVDNLCRGHRKSVPANLLHVVDLADRGRLHDVFESFKPDSVVHYAAFAEVGTSVRDPSEYYYNNIVNTLHLLEACRSYDVKRFVFSSTCATYGVPETDTIAEDHPQRPINPYGRTKLVIEWALEDYSKAYGIGFVIFRYFNAAGAAPDASLGEDHTPETHLIPNVLLSAQGKRPGVDVYGSDYPTPDGTCIRDYIHVDDLASAHLLGLEAIQPGTGAKFNLGTGRGHSVLEVIDACRAVTGLPITVNRCPRRPGDPPKLVANPTRAHQKLGWTPQFTDLKRIVETAWNWHQTHPSGFGDT